jgi:hypothetical protein
MGYYYAVQDVIDHLISASGGGTQDAEQRELRSSVHHAYRDLINAKDWAWHVTQGRIMLEPAETVSVTIGGSGTTLTRGSGVWPAGATSYRAYHNGVVAQVKTRTSDTVLTLSDTFKFPASFDGSSKSVILYRNTYQLPSNFRNMDALITQDRTSITSYVNPTDWARIERSILLSGDPVYWTVMRDEQSTVPDKWVVRVCGYPTAAETLDYTYRRKIVPPRWTGYETGARAGTVTCPGSTAVTGTNTQFVDSMVDCVFRIIDSSVNYPEPISGIYPYSEQSIIEDVVSGTSLTLKDALVSSYTDRKYVVSSLLDLSDGMFSALLSGAELWLARMRRQDAETAAGAYMRDLRMAMEADQMAPISGRRSALLGNPEFSYGTAIRTAPIAPDNG